MIKGFKIRIYPTREQEKLIWLHIGACRFVWNYMLDLQINRRESGEKHLSRFDMIKMLVPIKQTQEYEWLNDISADSLQRTCTTLANSYDSFFNKRSGFPKFKSRKHSKASYPVSENKAAFYFEETVVQIQKLGRVKYKSDLKFKQGTGNKFINVRISFTNGKYMLSFGMECENQAHKLTDKSIGIDLGIKELAVAACGDSKLVFSNINKSKKVRELKKNIKHIQRTISRKYEASKARTGKYEKTRNIKREEDKLRRLYAKLAGVRQNYLHQVTHKLISLLPSRIVMEDLNVTGMMKNKHLSKAIQEQCFCEFIRQIRYKCEWNGIEFIQAPRFYPSSKTCSRCGSIKSGLKLSDRTYACHECGLAIDRDYNAAINLMRYVGLQAQATA